MDIYWLQFWSLGKPKIKEWADLAGWEMAYLLTAASFGWSLHDEETSLLSSLCTCGNWDERRWNNLTNQA